MDVIAGAGTNGAQQRAVHPRDERSVQLSRSPESLAVIVHVADEDVLHLEEAARVQQRQRISEAFARATRNIEPHIVWRLGEEILEVRAVQSRRDMVVLVVVERTEPLFELERLPDPAPALDTLCTREQRSRPVLQ